MHRKLFSLALIIFVALNAALAQQPAPTSVPSVERLRAHIEYLASDKLEGRRTGNPGANLAAEYIAREFSRYGLRRSIGRDLPGMSILEADSPNRYLQKFPYVAGVELGKGNILQLATKDRSTVLQFHVGEDWLPLGFSANTKVANAEIVFAGYGISSSELNYDDYRATSAKDRIAIVFSGTPDGDNPHGQFARAGEVRFKAVAAQAAGARALLIIAAEKSLKDDRLARLTYDNSGAAAIPVIVVSRRTAGWLLGKPDSTLEEFEKVADSRTVQLLTTPNPKPTAKWTDTKVAESAGLRLPNNKTMMSLETDVVRREVAAANVVGILDGSDPTLKNETIVIGAHYDHLGRGGEGSLAPKEGEIHHGADDNASGTAGVLELARIFSAQHPRPRRTIVFMAFSGEEEGLLGSNYYVNQPIVPLANTVAMINMDMIGRMKDNKLSIGGVGTAQGWRDVIAAANTTENIRVAATPETSGEIQRTSTSGMGSGVPMVTGINGRPIVSLGMQKSFDLTLNEDGYGPSDHSSFYLKQIPVLFFWTGTHEDYHKPSDTADKINYEGESRIVAMVAGVIRDLDQRDQRPTYTVAKSESSGRSMGFRVYLGTIPNYADANDGLLLDGVREDSPAARAGLKAGDKIVKLAGRDVRNVYDYTAALGEMKAGQEYEVELLRAGER
ncbi:MAG TPA: M20/M25/M40 family metallo-hydrolase, partial [Pyrinomonadaceae bacterium]|nr:M20/M25/M40 family metallo-hydrolase [Pyrinomonadaceae bacterium]